jgi:hypothetical protein
MNHRHPACKDTLLGYYRACALCWAETTKHVGALPYLVFSKALWGRNCYDCLRTRTLSQVRG